MSRWDDFKCRLDSFIESLGPLSLGLFVILGSIVGGIDGFTIGGVGGAILGILCGSVVGFLAWCLFVMGIAILWTLFILLIIPALIILLIYLLWGVGKP